MPTPGDVRASMTATPPTGPRRPRFGACSPPRSAAKSAVPRIIEPRRTARAAAPQVNGQGPARRVSGGSAIREVYGHCRLYKQGALI